MREYNVDVVVVGAGPGGSIAALELAKRKLSVLVLEKRQEIGAPKRCAEGLTANVLAQIGIVADKKWAVNEINGCRIYTPSMREVLVQPTGIMGYILERKVFEKHLAAEAIKAGARYMVKTPVTEVLKDGGRVVGVRGNHMGEDVVVRSKVVIAADGVDSMTAKRAGIDTVNRLTDYHSGFQYEMAGVNAAEDKLHIFIGNKIAPRGYIWIFPKGNTVANVGIGIVGSMSGEDGRARDYLDAFIRDNPRFFGGASPIEINGGGIPVAISLKTFVADGFMVVGDAAQQVNPIHGGGIALAMRAAKLAAGVAADAIGEGNVSGERLREYETKWQETDGARLKKLLKLRGFIEKMEDKEFETLGRALQGDDVLKLVGGELSFLPKVLLTKAPMLLPLAKKYIID
jgi:digeranylgeranylglycerophospholipid reductase